MELILLLISSLLLTTRAATASNAVLDVDGNELQRGQRYYAVSTLRPGGGLTLVRPQKGSCPLNVAQAPFNDILGRPIAFFPENPNHDTVQQGSTLNIMFPEPTMCPESTVWQIDRETGHVTTGGTWSRALGPHYSRFAIRQLGDSNSDYQIQVCPCSMGVDGPACFMACLGTLGLGEEEGKTTLISLKSNRPHIVRFVKVQEEEGSMIRSAVERPY